MRKATARGRVWPQSFSTDRRYGRLSLKACALFPLMWANADDQGRLPGDPEEIKYACCPNIDHITKTDVPELLEELDANQLIKLYTTSKTTAIQILDWWDIHRPQWAWPSDYPPPDGWQDRLRYKRGAKEVVKENWFSQVSENNASGEQHTATQVSNEIASGEQHVGTQVSNEIASGEIEEIPLTTLYERGNRKRKRKPKEERGNSPESLFGSQVRKPSPSLTSPTLFQLLVNTFPKAWGRMPDSRETAQLRDLGKEISSAGGATAEQVHDAFKEAAKHNKLHISYVAAILFKWLGLERGPP